MAVEQPWQSATIPTIEERREVATKLHLEGNLRDNVREFAAVARLQEEAGLNAADTYWKIAETQNALGSSCVPHRR